MITQLNTAEITNVSGGATVIPLGGVLSAADGLVADNGVIVTTVQSLLGAIRGVLTAIKNLGPINITTV